MWCTLDVDAAAESVMKNLIFSAVLPYWPLPPTQCRAYRPLAPKKPGPMPGVSDPLRPPANQQPHNVCACLWCVCVYTFKPMHNSVATLLPCAVAQHCRRGHCSNHRPAGSYDHMKNSIKKEACWKTSEVWGDVCQSIKEIRKAYASSNK